MSSVAGRAARLRPSAPCCWACDDEASCAISTAAPGSPAEPGESGASCTTSTSPFRHAAYE
jgi:hypothetical protein